MNIHAVTCTRATSPARLQLLRETVEGARALAGIDFTWHIHVNDAPQAVDLCAEMLSTSLITSHSSSRTNLGQHVPFNDQLAAARLANCDYFLRLDDDVEFVTKKWLDRLCKASSTLSNEMILSPMIRGLINPPVTSSLTRVKGVPLLFLVEAIGGICRLHPIKLMTGYSSDVRQPLGAGDATGIATYCRARGIPMAYVSNIVVRHARTTLGQRQEDPEYHCLQPLFQAIPYIPAWS